jgi:hypothetical protein
MFGSESYSIRKIKVWLDKNNYTKYKVIRPNIGFGFIGTGLKLDLLQMNDSNLSVKYYLSIQTDPMVASESFAETALLLDDKLVHEYDYVDDGVIRHYEPENLYKHIIELTKQIKDDFKKNQSNKVNESNKSNKINESNESNKSNKSNKVNESNKSNKVNESNKSNKSNKVNESNNSKPFLDTKKNTFELSKDNYDENFPPLLIKK